MLDVTSTETRREAPPGTPAHTDSMIGVPVQERLALAVDASAQRWLDDHPGVSQLFITYLSSRACCSGARVCDVRIRVDIDATTRSREHASWSAIGRVDDRDVFIDTRLVGRMPAQLCFIERGFGPFRHLDLDLTGEQWADVLYPVAR
jgi:hypothetical protein